MKPTILTEEEFVTLLETGKAPAWLEVCKPLSPDTKLGRPGSHNDRIDADPLTREYLVRQLGSLFGGRRIPKKKHQAGITYAILELAKLEGLIVEEEPIGATRVFVSTERMSKYWSLMFAGEPLPVAKKDDLC
jgi:hypothetical protein